MPMKRVKRVIEKENKRQNMKAKNDLELPWLEVITNMQPMKLDICWSPQWQRDF